MKNEQPKRMALLCLIIISTWIFSCKTDSTSNYGEKTELTLNQLVEKEIELESDIGIKNDTLLLGLRVGMTFPQVDSALKKAVKDSLIVQRKNDYLYTITRYDVSGNPYKYVSILTTIHDDLTSKLVGVNLFFLEGDSKTLMYLFNEKYGEVKYHSEEDNDVRDVYITNGKAIEFKTYIVGTMYNVTYTGINYLKQQLEKTEKEEALETEKQLQEKERKEKSGKAGTKAI